MPNRTRCQLHIPHKEWAEVQEAENYRTIERWSNTPGCGTVLPGAIKVIGDSDFYTSGPLPATRQEWLSEVWALNGSLSTPKVFLANAGLWHVTVNTGFYMFYGSSDGGQSLGFQIMEAKDGVSEVAREVWDVRLDNTYTFIQFALSLSADVLSDGNGYVAFDRYFPGTAVLIDTSDWTLNAHYLPGTESLV
jgi:hypothetical protein